jgi:hypothetical protein
MHRIGVRTISDDEAVTVCALIFLWIADGACEAAFSPQSPGENGVASFSPLSGHYSVPSPQQGKQTRFEPALKGAREAQRQAPDDLEE